MKSVKRKTAGWTIRAFGALWAAGLLICVFVSACDPISPEDKAFFEAQERERSQREASFRAASSAVKESDIIANVQQYKSPDDKGTMQQWLDRQIADLNGQVMFPKWTTKRRGSNIQEVMFNFILVDSQNRMRRLEYRWDVDVLDMTVGKPQFAELEQIDSPDQTIVNQQLRRVREHEKSLE